MEPEVEDPDQGDPEHGWNPQADRTLRNWMEKARGNYLMHVATSQHYRKILLWLSIPIFVLGAFSGIKGTDSALRNRECIGDGEATVELLTSLTTLLVAALSAIMAFLDPKQKMSVHKNAADDFAEMTMELRYEYDRPWKTRTSHAVLMKKISLDVSKANRSTDPIPDKIKAKFETIVSKSNDVDTGGLPDIIVPIGRRSIPVPTAISRRVSESKENLDEIQVDYDPDNDREGGDIDQDEQTREPTLFE